MTANTKLRPFGSIGVVGNVILLADHLDRADAAQKDKVMTKQTSDTSAADKETIDMVIESSKPDLGKTRNGAPRERKYPTLPAKLRRALKAERERGRTWKDIGDELAFAPSGIPPLTKRGTRVKVSTIRRVEEWYGSYYDEDGNRRDGADVPAAVPSEPEAPAQTVTPKVPFDSGDEVALELTVGMRFTAAEAMKLLKMAAARDVSPVDLLVELVAEGLAGG